MKVIKFKDRSTIKKIQRRIMDEYYDSTEDWVMSIAKNLIKLKVDVKNSQVIPLQRELLQQISRVENELRKLKTLARKSDSIDPDEDDD